MDYLFLILIITIIGVYIAVFKTFGIHPKEYYYDAKALIIYIKSWLKELWECEASKNNDIRIWKEEKKNEN